MFTLLFVSALAAVAVAQNPDADAQIVNSESVINPDGTFSYRYATTNEIFGEEEGKGGKYSRGSSKYTSPEGEAIELTYNADEKGFQPSGRHLPVQQAPPPHVITALEFIRANPPQDDPNFDINALEQEIARLQALQ